MLSGQETLQGNFKTGLIDREDVPGRLKAFLIDCIQFDPEKRPDDNINLIEPLEALQQEHPWSRKEDEDW